MQTTTDEENNKRVAIDDQNDWAKTNQSFSAAKNKKETT
jgi:hypothetical protein